MTIRPVDPLLHNVPIVDAAGRPTPQFSRLWMQARTVDAAVVSTSDTVSGLETGFTEHAAATAGVHGIADTSLLVLDDDVRLSDARVPLPHAASHYAGPDALDLDSIDGQLDASKLYGVGVVAEMASTGELLATRIAVYDDPEFPGHAAFAVEAGGGGQFYMGDGFSATDLVAGRIAAGVFGTALGVLRADELGGSGQTSAYHLDRANHTGIEPLSALEQGTTGQVLRAVTGTAPEYGQIDNSHVADGADIAWAKISKTGAVPGDVGAAAAVHTHSAVDISSGTLADARLSSNVPLKNAATNAFTGNLSVAGSQAWGGASLTADRNISSFMGGMTGATQYGFFSRTVAGSTATTAAYGVYFRIETPNTAFTCARAVSMAAIAPVKGAASTITDAMALYVDGSGTGAANNWAIYTDGTNISRFGGPVRIAGALDHDGTTVGFYGVTPVARAAAIAAPAGGATIDAEARTAIDAIRTALANVGLTL